MKNRLLETVMAVCIYSLIVFTVVGVISKVIEEVKPTVERINERGEYLESLLNE